MIYEMDLKHKYEQGAEEQYQKDYIIIAEQADTISMQVAQLSQKDETISALSNRIRELEALMEN